MSECIATGRIIKGERSSRSTKSYCLYTQPARKCHASRYKKGGGDKIIASHLFIFFLLLVTIMHSSQTHTMVMNMNPKNRRYLREGGKNNWKIKKTTRKQHVEEEEKKTKSQNRSTMPECLQSGQNNVGKKKNKNHALISFPFTPNVGP